MTDEDKTNSCFFTSGLVVGIIVGIVIGIFFGSPHDRDVNRSLSKDCRGIAVTVDDFVKCSEIERRK